MKLSAFQLRALVVQAGLPGYAWHLADGFYETVSGDWVTRNWEAWLDSRPGELVITADAGGKRVRVRPLWIVDACDCDNLALGLVAHGDVGNALAAARGQKAARGGLAFGAMFYTALQARSENFGVKGPHAINWFIDHESRVKFFEPGVGQLTDLSLIEKATATFGLAA